MRADSSDYDILVKPIENQMIQSVWRIVRDPNDADDAFQEATTTIWKQLGRIRRHPNPHALILKICTDAAYDVLRHRIRHKRGQEQEEAIAAVPDPAPAATQLLISRETQAEILQAIGQLSPKQGTAVLMRFVNGLSYNDIAQSFGCREATVRKHVARARDRLYEVLEHLLPKSTKEVNE
ncbi:MAG: RNA polymerase sigma factor [Deltaproteobacteria bacterium]|nr:RNA polymerase sigma factor [Deltaproteobacteria bacterium]